VSFGLSGVADWSVQQPFLDVFKTAREWHGHTPSQWGAYRAEDLDRMGVLDADGWITRMPGGVDRVETFILTEMPAEARYTAGTYRLSYDGAGQINVYGAEIVSQSAGEIWFNYTPTGAGMVTVSITGTDPQNTGNYLRNIEVVKQEHIPAFEAGEMFNPLWLDVIRDAHALRFMDWQETNNSTLQHWSDRPTQGSYSYADGVPVEVMVALANTTGTEPWFNMPWDADETYIRNFASYVRENLNPELRAHYEMSNEVWNWQFTQAQDAGRSATERFGQELGDGWVQEYGARAAEMARVLDSVYAGAEDQLVKVIATHTYWPGLEESVLEAPAWQALGSGNAAPYLSFDTYAVTGYFGNSLGTDEKAPAVLDWIARSEAQARQEASAQGLSGSAAQAYFAEHRFDLAEDLAIRELRDGSVTGNAEDSLQGLFELFRYHKGVADAHGLDLVMYEGGTHVVGIGQWVHNNQLTEFFAHLNYSDGMGELYAELLAGWDAAGGTLFNAFVDVAEPSQWGSWGSLRHLQDSTSRHDAVMDFLQSHPAPASMKDDTSDNGDAGFGPAPEPDRTAEEDDDAPVVTPQPRPQPQPEPTPQPEPEPTPQPEPEAQPLEAIREYVFGNDLFAWGIGDPEIAVPYWTDWLADAAGISYTTAIQTGMLTRHDDLPPRPHLLVDGVDASWDPDTGQSFAEAGFTRITLSAVNFVQSQSPDTPYWHEPDTSPLDAALRIIDWTQARAPGAAVTLYETWPELDGVPTFDAWIDHMTGEWHDWWVDLADMIQQARPDLDLRLISVGPRVAEMIATPGLGLQNLTARDLFLDDEGHPTPTLAFLASLLHFSTLTGASLPQTITLPDAIHPDVAKNYPQIANWIAETGGHLPTPLVAPFSERFDAVTTVAGDAGSSGDDVLQPGPATKVIDGGAGFDTVLLTGDQAFHTLTIGDGLVWIENRAQAAAPLQLRNIEQIRFERDASPFDAGGVSIDQFDGMAELTPEAMTTLTELYIAYFNRAPDAVGLFFWGNQMADGMSLTEIAGYFFDQPETRNLYGDVADLSGFVRSVYENVLGRAPDAAGLAFWRDVLEVGGSLAPDRFILALLDGAKAETGDPDDAAYLANKVTLGSHFAVARGMSDVRDALDVMDGFDGTIESLQTGIAQTDAYHDALRDGTAEGFLMQLVGISGQAVDY
jgi:hypothetical protein